MRGHGGRGRKGWGSDPLAHLYMLSASGGSDKESSGSAGQIPVQPRGDARNPLMVPWFTCQLWRLG